MFCESNVCGPVLQCSSTTYVIRDAGTHRSVLGVPNVGCSQARLRTAAKAATREVFRLLGLHWTGRTTDMPTWRGSETLQEPEIPLV